MEYRQIKDLNIDKASLTILKNSAIKKGSIYGLADEPLNDQPGPESQSGYVVFPSLHGKA